MFGDIVDCPSLSCKCCGPLWAEDSDAANHPTVQRTAYDRIRRSQTSWARPRNPWSEMQAIERSQCVFTVPYREALSFRSCADSGSTFIFFPRELFLNLVGGGGDPFRRDKQTHVAIISTDLFLDEVAQR